VNLQAFADTDEGLIVSRPARAGDERQKKPVLHPRIQSGLADSPFDFSPPPSRPSRDAEDGGFTIGMRDEG
jgi:hypothetical protein